MELTYHREGDYLIPDLRLSDESGYRIGKYGRMRKQFLKEHHGGIYSGMVLTETLWKHLEAVDSESNGMLERLVSQMAEREGVTEQLKASDQMEWLRRMNSIHNRAEEIVLHDLIYTL